MPNFQGAVNSTINTLLRTNSIKHIVSQGELANRMSEKQLQETINQRTQFEKAMLSFKREFNESYTPKAVPTEIAVTQANRARAEGAEQERRRRASTLTERYNILYGGDTNGTTPTA